MLLVFACDKKNTVEVPQVEEKPIDFPHISINTIDFSPIVSKTQLSPAKISIQGGKDYADFLGTTQIRGRGNYTWILPKKPYKIKLDNESEMFNLQSEKDWVLLSNYLDGSHMLNAVSMKIGQLLGMPYANHMIPVELTLNGRYQGLYGFTEQIEVKENRVNVGKDGLLLVLDTNYDDQWKFRSNIYNLPVMIKYPAIANQAEVLPIKAQFERLEGLISRSDFPNNNYLDYFDANAMANYYLVYLLTCNEEINHPKSTYIYKTASGKFTMGPIWDFDWAFSYEQNQTHFINPERPLFWKGSALGAKFFSRIMEDPKIKNLVYQKWRDFRADKYDKLDSYILEYSKLIAKARKKDYDNWFRGNADFDVEIANIRQWFVRRGNYIDKQLN